MAVGARLLDLFDRLQADDQVVVLVLDDLQWADRPSLRAVLFALRRLRADKVLIVVSARSGALVDAGWARFVGGDSRVMRVRLGGLEAGDLHRAGRCPGSRAAVTSGSVPAGGTHGRACPPLPGAARRDGRRGIEREGRGVAGAEGAVVGDPRPCGRAVDGDAGVPGGGVGVGPPRVQGDDRIGRPAVRRRRRGRRSRRLGPARGGSDTNRAGFSPPAVPGRHL